MRTDSNLSTGEPSNALKSQHLVDRHVAYGQRAYQFRYQLHGQINLVTVLPGAYIRGRFTVNALHTWSRLAQPRSRADYMQAHALLREVELALPVPPNCSSTAHGKPPMPKITKAKLLAAATTMLILLVACNPDLLPLVPVVDAIGLDVLVLLLGAQLVAVLPWVRAHAAGPLRMAVLAAGALFAGFIGGYLRQLLFGSDIRHQIQHIVREALPRFR